MDALGDELELALRMADAADAIALRHFRDPRLAVDTKPDGSPVSSADREIELELRALLEDRRPGAAILGEEGGASGDGDHRWYLDPIDGTSNFVAADPEWYVLIALAVDGRPVVGVVSAPALGERWWASRGAGAFRDGSRISVSDVGQLAEATVADDWQQRLARGVTGHPLATLAGTAARVRRHSGHSHLVIASGEADLDLRYRLRMGLRADQGDRRGGGRAVHGSARPRRVRQRRCACLKRTHPRPGFAGPGI